MTLLRIQNEDGGRSDALLHVCATVPLAEVTPDNTEEVIDRYLRPMLQALTRSVTKRNDMPDPLGVVLWLTDFSVDSND